MKILFVLGTRPEAIKLAPVILAARRRPAEFQPVVASTGQHRELLDSALKFFALEPDHDLELMAEGQTLAQLTARVVEAMDGLLRRVLPEVNSEIRRLVMAQPCSTWTTGMTSVNGCDNARSPQPSIPELFG